MKLAQSVLATVVFTLSVFHHVDAFQPIALVSSLSSSSRTTQRSSTSIRDFALASIATGDGSAPCAMPDNELIPEGVTAKVLRSALLTNASGDIVNLNEKMGPGTSIVIFLRHLG